MIKLNSATEFEDGNITLLDLSLGLEKRASCDAIQEFLSTLKPIPGKSYIQVAMLGSSEHYSCTRNGDHFTEAALIKYHKTFETSPAKLFKHHRNKKDSPSFGICIFSTYNLSMHRIELIMQVDEELSLEIDQMAKQGKYHKTSMACKTGYDVCSICGNVAKTREDYCTHLSTQMNKLYPDGRKVMALNTAPITWFDCSVVAMPADVTSSILVKVAEDEPTIGSAELAEIEGLTEKTSEFKKWSELVKEISDSGEVLEDVTGILSKTKDLPLTLVEPLHHFSLNQSLAAMAVLGISPSIEFLSELIARKHLGAGYEGIGMIVEEFIHNVEPDETVPAINIDDVETPNPLLVRLIAPYSTESSLLSSNIEKRASGVGYAHNGPFIEPTPEEEAAMAKAALPTNAEFKVPYGKLLLGLGASALLAKWYISSQIEKQMRLQRLQRPQNSIKIDLTKRASEYQAAASLSRSTLHPYVASKKSSDEAGGVAMPSSTSVAKRLLSSSKTKIGGKLSSLLRIIGLGQKVSDTITY